MEEKRGRKRKVVMGCSPGGGYLVYFANWMCTPFRASLSSLFSNAGNSGGGGVFLLHYKFIRGCAPQRPNPMNLDPN